MKKVFLAFLCLTAVCICRAKELNVSSPDGHIRLTIDEGKYSVTYDGKTVIDKSLAALTLDSGATVSLSDKVKRTKTGKLVSEHIDAPFYRQKSFDFLYNSLRIDFRNGFSIEWIVSDEGVAYRFATVNKGETVVKDETAVINFPEDRKAWLPYSTNPKKPQAMAFQNWYTVQNLSDGSEGNLAFLPATVDAGPVKVTVLESDLRSYPGMFVQAEKGSHSLKGVFSRYPKTFDNYRGRVQRYVTSTEDYIAKSTGARTYPWRILAISSDDTQMPVNNMVYALAQPSKIEDTSWIHPGFSAWEWWNDWQLTGVDFHAGINMDTYKYYIDFASRNGLEYVILDEGWYVPYSGDMLTPIKELDIPGLVKYAADRNVKLILWCVFNVLDDNLEEICEHYSKMGIAGFKVDFLDRDDQDGIEMTYRIADAAARHHLILDLHGISKPTGINRTYPNVLNYESIFGQEEVRWSEVSVDMPLYNVTAPFIRMMAGYTDYTPGAMRNAAKADFHPVYNNSMSMGTRANQVALYTVYDSPLTMLCDSPTMYENEKETLDYLSSLPREYDEEKILCGKIGEFIVVARRSGENWYLGGLTSWEGRDITVDFGFLGDGEWNAQLFRDGVNADRNAEDYKIESFSVGSSDKRTVRLASGGGFSMKITK